MTSFACIFGHRWEFVSATFTPPTGQAVDGEGAAMYRFAEKVTFGYTTIRQRCKVCGWTSVTTVVGDAR